jgi:23S rRNA (cytidine1920-2'-O)/16S rRNA (cytidine1409-2'-O)-methyltransferase
LGDSPELVTSNRIRLDALLVARGLVESRERARALILAGQVTVAGNPIAKAGTLIPADAEVHVASPEHPWVGRGGVKLAHALTTFGISVADRVALDIGASTGGFTDVLLHHGARHVVALDVGHGQLHWKLRTDPRVTVIEGVNARSLARDTAPSLANGADLITIDVSFISLKLILPSAARLLNPDGDVIALVKPQFEAGRHDVGRGGIVRDESIHARVIDEVTAAAAEVGLSRMALIESPITGAEGNREFLLHLRRPSDRPSLHHADPVMPPGQSA